MSQPDFEGEEAPPSWTERPGRVAAIVAVLAVAAAACMRLEPLDHWLWSLEPFFLAAWILLVLLTWGLVAWSLVSLSLRLLARMFDRDGRPWRQVVRAGDMALAVSALVLVSGVGHVLDPLGRRPIRDNSANSNARNRILVLYNLVEERAPGAESLGELWKRTRADDWDQSPWGGKIGPASPTGLIVAPDVVGTHASRQAVLDAAVGDTAGLSKDPSRAANMLYVRIRPGKAGAWHGIRADSTGQVAPVHEYAVGICAKDGTPWWDVYGKGRFEPPPQ